MRWHISGGRPGPFLRPWACFEAAGRSERTSRGHCAIITPDGALTDNSTRSQIHMSHEGPVEGKCDGVDANKYTRARASTEKYARD